MTENMLTIATAKGYLLKESLEKFKQIGIIFNDDLTTSRKLSTIDTTGKIKLLQVRPWDVTEYVEHGGADLGIVGKDVLVEKENNILQLCDLRFGHCKLVLAGLKRITPEEIPHALTIATKYPNTTHKYFSKKGLNINIIKLYGSIELAPSTRLSHLITDLTVTGTTLKENNLHIIDTLVTSTAFLIANKASLQLNHDSILSLTKKIQTTC